MIIFHLNPDLALVFTYRTACLVPSDRAQRAANCGECGKTIWNDITDILTIIDLNKSMGDLLLQKHVVKPALFFKCPYIWGEKH